MALESTIEKGLADYAHKLGMMTYKFVSPARRGVPDRLFIKPGGKTLFMEVKAPGGRPTELQMQVMRKMYDFGVAVCWTDDLEQGQVILLRFMKHGTWPDRP